eukprot:60616_1
MSFEDTSKINLQKPQSKRRKLNKEIEECPNIDTDDDGILLILERYYISGFRADANGQTQNFRELNTIFYKNDYKNGLDDNDTYLDAISKGNVKLAINLIENNSVNPLYIKWGTNFGTAHALHYILQNLKYIKSKTNKQHPKYKELILFIEQYLLPQMNEKYINTKYFRGGDILHRGTRFAIMEMIVSVNDIDLLKLIINNCKHIIHFNEKTNSFGGSAYGSKEWSILDYCIDHNIDVNIFEYLLTESCISINVNEYLSSYAGFITNTEKYTILHKIIKNNHIKLFKMLMSCTKNVNINITHETVNLKKKETLDSSSEYDNYFDEKTTETSLHIAIKNNNEYFIKLLIIHAIDVNIEYLISVRDKISASYIDKKGIDIFDFINKIKDKTIETNDYIVNTFNETNIKNILIQRYYPDMIDEYPLNIQKSIKVIFDRFPNIGEIILARSEE